VTDSKGVAQAYDGTSTLMRLLRIYGWGPMLNLGYFRIVELPLLVFGLRPFQKRLAREAVGLLDPRPGERVVEAACGMGWTAWQMARRGVSVLAVDLVDAHIRGARENYGDAPGLSYLVGDASVLAVRKGEGGDPGEGPLEPLAPASVDAILCLEAAFQFGSEGRRSFLRRASEVLRPGGRLVLVDFVWATPHPEEIELLDPDRLVRDTWRFEQFEPLESYRQVAREYGLKEDRLVDWTRPVTTRFQQVGNALLWVGRTAAGRFLLSILRGGGFEYGRKDWEEVRRIIDAHDRVRSRSRYVALVLKKAASEGLDARGCVVHKDWP
jgi:SAM-dependent methyltransferase